MQGRAQGDTITRLVLSHEFDTVTELIELFILWHHFLSNSSFFSFFLINISCPIHTQIFCHSVFELFPFISQAIIPPLFPGRARNVYRRIYRHGGIIKIIIFETSLQLTFEKLIGRKSLKA